VRQTPAGAQIRKAFACAEAFVLERQCGGYYFSLWFRAIWKVIMNERPACFSRVSAQLGSMLEVLRDNERIIPVMAWQAWYRRWLRRCTLLWSSKALLMLSLIFELSKIEFLRMCS